VIHVSHKMLSLTSTLPTFAPVVPAMHAPARASSPVMVERSAAIPFLKKPPALDGPPSCHTEPPLLSSTSLALTGPASKPPRPQAGQRLCRCSARIHGAVHTRPASSATARMRFMPPRSALLLHSAERLLLSRLPTGSMAGDVGFDPLGFSTTVTELGGDLNYVREAELMHGRQAMLATVGFIWPSTFGKIIAADVPLNPLEVQYSLPGPILAQLLVFIATAEGLRSRIIYSEGGVPGEHLDDELKGKLIKFFQLDTPEKMMAMKTKEIKHCRLAMIAITGMFFQDAITGGVYPIF